MTFGISVMAKMNTNPLVYMRELDFMITCPLNFDSSYAQVEDLGHLSSGNHENPQKSSWKFMH